MLLVLELWNFRNRGKKSNILASRFFRKIMYVYIYVTFILLSIFVSYKSIYGSANIYEQLLHTVITQIRYKFLHTVPLQFLIIDSQFWWVNIIYCGILITYQKKKIKMKLSKTQILLWKTKITITPAMTEKHI